MKATYTNIAVIVLALVAVYFSLEQSRKFKQVQSDRISFTNQNSQLSKKIDLEKINIIDNKGVLAEVNEQRAVLQASVDARQAEAENYQLAIGKHDAIIAQIEDQKGKIAKLKEDLNQKLGKFGGNFRVDNLDAALGQVQDQKASLVAKLDEIDVLTASAKKSIETNKEERARLTKREEERVAQLERNSLEAVITGVNQDWGFVVIGAGANSGFTPQSGLIVRREGQMIARVRPSSIEPTQTIAEINFDSLAPGVRIQPGDSVIFASPNLN